MGPIPYAKQTLTEEDRQAVLATLGADYLTTGPKIDEFERAFAEYIGAPFAVAVANGTAALHLCAKALKISSGMRALCPSLTFAASANCILHEGGEIDFVDIDPESGLMDLDLLEEKLQLAPANYYQCIIPVDFAGHSIQMDRVKRIADSFGCKIIEDSCHAPGGYFMDANHQVQQVGNGEFADLSIFSFHPTKHITTGEGGMITTKNEDLYHQLKLLRNHGICKDPQGLQKQDGAWYYELQALGLNYRMNDIQATLGLSQLKKAPAWLEKRKEIAARYRMAFKDTPVNPLKHSEGHAYHLFVVQVPERRALYEYLREKNIYCQVHYVPLHMHPFYQEKGWKTGDLPKTEAYYNACLSLPMYATLTEEEQDYVIKSILGFF